MCASQAEGEPGRQLDGFSESLQVEWSGEDEADRRLLRSGPEAQENRIRYKEEKAKC